MEGEGHTAPPRRNARALQRSAYKPLLLGSVLQRLLSLRAATTAFLWRARDCEALPWGRVRPSSRSIARGKSNFQLVELVPLRFRSLFIRYGEKGLQAPMRGHFLRYIHVRIVPCTPCRWRFVHVQGRRPRSKDLRVAAKGVLPRTLLMACRRDPSPKCPDG
jgi:hypothetical protein